MCQIGEPLTCSCHRALGEDSQRFRSGESAAPQEKAWEPLLLATTHFGAPTPAVALLHDSVAPRTGGQCHDSGRNESKFKWQFSANPC